MEEDREQPTIMPATALNPADDESAMSEVGSLEVDLGKFKNVQALLDAYNSLQSEFTKKCQMLSRLEKDKMDLESKETTTENGGEEELNSFLEGNMQAQKFADEIKNKFAYTKKLSPFEVAWAEVVLSHLQEGDKISDPIINQYVLSDEKVKNKIITDFIKDLGNTNSPIIMSSQSGERLSGVLPDNPKTLDEAKRIVDKMFE